MRDDAIVYLMYHELEVEGRPLCQSEPGYMRYAVRELQFRDQINYLRSAGMRGISVSDALGNTTSGGVVITFDDGCETDLTVAAPILRQANFGATFYITLGFLGRSGYMTPRQVRELNDAGFEIGCHSMTHPYLSDLSTAELNREMAEAKTQLEGIIGGPVHHFSCPGGRWSANIAAVGRRAGYHSIACSRIAVNRPSSDPFQLARIAVMRGVPFPTFQDFCAGRRLWRPQLRNMLQSASHQILGNSLYDRLRRFMLERED